MLDTMAAKDGDGWVQCAQGHRHWGRYGASGLLAVHHDAHGRARLLMQERALWSHYGGTWGLPGGARDSHENSITTALREAEEEAAVDGTGLRIEGVYLDDHGGWSFETVIAEADRLLDAYPANAESTALCWLSPAEVEAKRLHPGFAASWGEIRQTLDPWRIVLDIANIVGARAEHGWWKDRRGAAGRLLHEVAATEWRHPILDQWFPKVVAVVEGAARGVPPVPGVEVVEAPGSGDDTLVEMVRRAEPYERVILVTADRGLRARVPEARSEGPRWLLGQLPA